MDLTTRIFRDLAVLANWAFQSIECEPGAYKLAEVAKNKYGKFNIDCNALQTSSLPECAEWENESEYIVKLSYNGGMQVYTFYLYNVFDLMARFKKIATEDITAKEKGELCTMKKGNVDEMLNNTVRAKVLQYKPDGNTLTEKWETLTKYAEGIYYSVDKGTINGDMADFRFEKNGTYWDAIICDRVEYIELRREKITEMFVNFEANVISRAERGMFINTLHIEVMRRLGYDTAPLYVSRETYLKNREEEEKRKHEEEQRREQERREAEERRKAEVLADGKKKLMNHERITVEQIELVAEYVGYKIHIRTIGFMREKLTEVVMLDDDRVQVFGYKLTSRNIDGTAKVMHELYDRLKAQAEEELEQPATPTETPRISTETAETVNVSVEGENEAETKEMPQILTSKQYPISPKLAKAGIIINGASWHTEYLDQAHNVLARVDNLGWDMKMYTFPYQGSGVFGKTELFENWEDAVIATIDALTDYLHTENTEPPQSPERKIKYFHYTPEQLERYIIDVYDKRANGEWVLLPYEQIDTDAGLWDVVDGKIGWWTNWRREKFSEMNMDFNSPTCGRCFRVNRTYTSKSRHTARGKYRSCYTIMDAHGDFAVDDFSYTKRGIMQCFKSPEAPQTRQNREERQENGDYHTFGAVMPKRQTSRMGRYSPVGGAVTHRTRDNAAEQTRVPVVGGYQPTRGSTLAI